MRLKRILSLMSFMAAVFMPATAIGAENCNLYAGCTYEFICAAEYVPEITKEAKTKEKEIDSKERDLLARLIYAEAGNQPQEIMYYVGSVVLNRVEDDDFPDTIEEVIFQRNPIQYGCTVDGNFEKEPSEIAFAIAEDLLNNGSRIPKGVVFQAEFIQGTIWKRYNNIIFCYK